MAAFNIYHSNGETTKKVAEIPRARSRTDALRRYADSMGLPPPEWPRWRPQPEIATDADHYFALQTPGELHSVHHELH